MKTLCIAALALAACAPTTNTTTPVYAGQPRTAAAGKPKGIALRGRVPRGQRVDYIVAVQVDRQGRRQRIRVRPAADGSYALQLPRGHRYAMAYEQGGRLVGNVSFPGAGGRVSHTINVSQNVVVNQQFVDASDPEAYLDSDGDGISDALDTDDDSDHSEDNVVADTSAFDGDFEEVDEGDGGGNDGSDGN